MIYFLVNNDYQLLDANRHAVTLNAEGEKVSLILVPHTQQCTLPADRYSNILRFDSPAKGRRWPAAWLLYFRAYRKVQSELRPGSEDTLIFYSEYELLNQFIVKRFRKARGKVVMIEDGGVGTYLPFSNVASMELTWRERIRLWSVRSLPGLSRTRFNKINGVVFPWLPDEEIDLLCVYREFKPQRNIRTLTIRNNVNTFQVTPRPGRVLFLNECIYDHYQNDATYLRGLNAILAGLTAGYAEVLFKFHPRDSRSWRARIQEQVLSQYPSVQVIKDDRPVELLLENYAPETLASYFSTPLLNLSGTGIEPLFLYHLLDDLKDQPFFAQLTALLHQWDYQFVEDWSAVRSGYTSSIRLGNNFNDLPLLSEALGTRNAWNPTITIADRGPRTWANIAFYLGATACTSVLGLFTTLFMARLITPVQYGRVGIFLSMFYFAVPMISLSAEGLIAVNLSTLDETEYNHFRSSALAIGFSVFLALQVIGLALWAVGIAHDPLLLAVPAYALLRLGTTIAGTEYIVEQKANVYAVLMLFDSILAMSLTYAIMAWLSASAGARVAALMVAELMMILVRYRGRLGLLLRPKFHAKYVRQIVAFGIPSMIALFGGWGLNASDMVVVAHGCGLAVAGVYAAAASLSSIMMSINQALTNALFPGLYARLRARTQTVRKLMTEYVLKFLGLIASFAVLMIVGYFLTKGWLLPKKYAVASTYFYALILASLSVAIFRPVGLISDFFKQARARAVALTFGGSATILVAVAGIHYTRNPLWAPAGIAVGYLLSALILGTSLIRRNLYEKT
jgi:O-antigen/teichoic acid export membrane protein